MPALSSPLTMCCAPRGWYDTQGNLRYQPVATFGKMPTGQQAKANMKRYLQELHCTDAYIQQVGMHAYIRMPAYIQGMGMHAYIDMPACSQRPHPASLSSPRLPAQVYGILQRAGRLHDTTIIITGDHGEGFQLTHSTDVIHGGSVYDSQVHWPLSLPDLSLSRSRSLRRGPSRALPLPLTLSLTLSSPPSRHPGLLVPLPQVHAPLVMIGPAAAGLPRRIGGVWSDVALAPTLIDAFGVRLPRTARMCPVHTPTHTPVHTGASTPAHARACARLQVPLRPTMVQAASERQDGPPLCEPIAAAATAAAAAAAATARPMAAAQAAAEPSAADGGGSAAACEQARLDLPDLYGRSLFRHWRSPPRQSYTSCAFDATCVGLVVSAGVPANRSRGAGGRTYKYVWQMVANQLEVTSLA